jgi:hypothetical protein
MQLDLIIAGFEGRTLMVQTGGLMSPACVRVDGVMAAKGPKRGQFIVRRTDGTEVIVHLRSPNFLDPVPQVIVEGKTYILAEPLQWHHWVWSCLPLALMIIGGALGGLLGGLAVVANGRLFRSGLGSGMKYVVTGAVSLTATVAFLIAAAGLQLSVADWFTQPQLFSSVPGRFSVVTPVRLTEATQTVVVAVMHNLDLHMFAGQDGNAVYYVSYVDYPAELVQHSDPDKMLEGSRDGARQKINGHITADVATTIGGYPGREFVMECTDEKARALHIKSRIVLVERRLYQLMAVIPKSAKKTGRADAFLRSFTLHDK